MALILLLCCHFLTGYGLLNLFSVRQKPLIILPLSFLLGIAVASFLPFLLQLLYCPLYPATVFGSMGLACVLLNLPLLRPAGSLLRKPPAFSFNIRIYELPFILFLAFLLFVSVWRCYYLPPTSRDALSGPEAIAEYAVREHTMINSFFTVDLSTTNNQFKSPFLISLQVIYKMAGFPFGQIWLSIIFVSFTVLLYQLLKLTLHPLLAGLLLLLFTMTPELYAYSFMILYDYSNMVYLFLSLYFLFGYFEHKKSSHFFLAALLMGIATYIRSETFVLAGLFLPALGLLLWRNGYPFLKRIRVMILFILPSFLSYFLSIYLYINYYLPVQYNIAALVNPHPFRLGPLFRLYGDIVSQLLVSEYSTRLWGYVYFVWAALFLGELLLLRRLNKAAINWLYAMGAVFIGLGLLGFLLPLFELIYTIKRGLFKMLPLMLLYMANNQWLIRLSARISRWEQGPSPSPDSPV